MKENKKIKKCKFVYLKHLEFALMLKRLRLSITDSNKIPYFKVPVKKGETALSINYFKEDGMINIDKIKYVTIYVPKKSLDSIDVPFIKKHDKKIQKVKSEYMICDYGNIELLGYIIPIKLFTTSITTTDHIDSLYALCTISVPIEGIKLLDKDKKCIAYALHEDM